ncbi:hypothetical protein JCM16358_06570 [Halanaerocella petrolearia]
MLNKDKVLESNIDELKEDMVKLVLKKGSLLDEEVQQLSRLLDREIVKFYESTYVCE